MQNSLAAAQTLKTSLLDHGVGRVVSPFTKRTGGVSIELQAGRGTGGRFMAQLNHDTVGPSLSSTTLTPSLYICKNGRSDLQGPLCNGYGGGDFVYRIITLEWANHPGLGGPLTTSGGTIPEDNGRPYLWGTEFEWDGVSAWPDDYLEWMARCNAGITDWLNHAITDQFEHKNWAPTRKIDRSPGITRTSSIDRTRAVYNDKGDDDVPNTELEIKTWVNDCIENKFGLRAGQNFGLAVFGQGDNGQVLNRITAMNNPGSIAAMVVGLVTAVADLTALVGSMKAELSDDEAKIIANANARADEIKVLLGGGAAPSPGA